MATKRHPRDFYIEQEVAPGKWEWVIFIVGKREAETELKKVRAKNPMVKYRIIQGTPK